MGISETRPLTPAKAARTKQERILADVAREAGISISLLSMIESGYVPPAGTRDRVAAALGSSTRVLWPEVA